MGIYFKNKWNEDLEKVILYFFSLIHYLLLFIIFRNY